MDQTAGYNCINTMNVEVVSWTEHRLELMDVIEQKCSRAYPAYFWLVIHADSENVVDLSVILPRIGQLQVPFAEMWIVGGLGKGVFRANQLHPMAQIIDFNLRESLAGDFRAVQFIRPQGRGRSTDLRDLGKIYLPIP